MLGWGAKMSKDVILKPRVSEKTYAMNEAGNIYTFQIPSSANKHSVAESIAKQYEVTVLNVRLASLPGKPKRTFRRGGRNVFKGNRSDIRKAYVTLAEGDKLPIFSAMEEADQKPEAK
jgi:large subunit ribosomal protein L23